MRHWLMAALVAPAALLILPALAMAGEVLPWQGGAQNDYQPAPYQPPGGVHYRKPLLRPAPNYAQGPAIQPPLTRGYDVAPQPPEDMQQGRMTPFEPNDITGAGHRFFGRITTDLASVIEYAFRNNGRPNGYILGEEGGGAFVAGLRYGEGTLFTKNAGTQKVFWQGPSIGYDFGGDAAKTMILVYSLNSPEDVFYDYVGVGGQAYIVGGVGMTYLKSGAVSMAPIRSGVGLRIGANVGYLKFTRQPTWNPF
jgi:hypothetical protein